MDERQVLFQMPCGVLVLDDRQRIIYANQWVVDLCGLAAERLAGRAVAELIDSWPLQTDSPPSDGDGEEVFSQDGLVRTASGEVLPVKLIWNRPAEAGATAPRCLCLLSPGVCTPRTVPVEPQIGERDRFHGLIGKTPQMQEIYNLIELAAGTDVNVVIQGESGTGKELVAAAIHHLSARRREPFVRVNCAALAETLLESELFGHVKGAFTGAYRDRLGKFEEARRGTIFLDEIGEISPAMQAKLLRVLQEKVVVRVGDNAEIEVDVRVIAATNRNLRSMVAKARFREDLLYRLNVFPIPLPPLRERATDIPLLCRHFCEKFRRRMAKPIGAVSADAMRILLGYCWPGNIRELENTIEHAFVLCRGEEIQVVDLPHELRVNAVREGICAERIAGVPQLFHPLPARPSASSRKTALGREQIEAELARQGGNKAATARALGISKVGLWKKMKKMGMEL